MRRINDLDDRDRAARAALHAQLVARRAQLGLTQRLVGERFGTDQANIRRLELKGIDQAGTTTVTRWARALDLRLIMEPVGFPPPTRYRPPGMGSTLALIAADRITDDNDGDVWAITKLVSDLAGIRLACAVTCTQLGKRLGVTEGNASLFETAGSTPHLVVLQRQARGIALCSRRARKAYLDVRLEEPAPQSCSADTDQLVPSEEATDTDPTDPHPPPEEG